MHRNLLFLILMLAPSLLLVCLAPSAGYAQSGGDAIAVRVLSNPGHYSAVRWYERERMAGSPQSIEVDGYRGVRDGNTVYINAANAVGHCSDNNTVTCSSDANCPSGYCSLDNAYTNIYVLAYNSTADRQTADIFGQILSYWKFNINMSQSGYCDTHNVLKTPDEESGCLADRDCAAGQFCNSRKAELARDVRKLEDMIEINEALKSYRVENNNRCPSLAAGTYYPGKTLSVWPSWQNELGRQLGGKLPIHPVNSLSNCLNPFATSSSLVKYDSKSCFNFDTKQFAGNLDVSPFELPLQSRSATRHFLASSTQIDQQLGRTALLQYLARVFLYSGTVPPLSPATINGPRENLYQAFAELARTAKINGSPAQADESAVYTYSAERNGASCSICTKFNSDLWSFGGYSCINGSPDILEYGNATVSCPSPSAVQGGAYSGYLLAVPGKNTQLSQPPRITLVGDWSSWPQGGVTVGHAVSGLYWQVKSPAVTTVAGTYDFDVAIDTTDGMTAHQSCSITLMSLKPLIKQVPDVRVNQGYRLDDIVIEASERNALQMPLAFAVEVRHAGGQIIGGFYEEGPLPTVLPAVMKSQTVYTATLPGGTVMAGIGDYIVTVTVTDKAGATETRIFKITVYNDPPKTVSYQPNTNLTASTTMPISHEIMRVADDQKHFDLAASLSGSILPAGLVSDGSGNVHNQYYRYVVGGILTNANIFNLPNTILHFALRIVDRFGTFADFPFTLTVNNSAPELFDISECTAISNVRWRSPISCTVRARDAQGNAITNFRLSNAPASLVITNHHDGTATVAGTPAFPDVGVHDIEIVAQDEFGYESAGSAARWHLAIEAWCGDGQISGTEQCDDAANNGVVTGPVYSNSNHTYSYCTASCARVTGNNRYCGDGSVSDSETCEGASTQACTTTYAVGMPAYCSGIPMPGVSTCNNQCGWGACVSSAVPTLESNSSTACAATSPVLNDYACCELVDCQPDGCSCCGRPGGSSIPAGFDNVASLSPCSNGTNSCRMNRSQTNLRNWIVTTIHTTASFRCWR